MDRLSDEELINQFRASTGPPQNNPQLNELFRRYHEKVGWWCWKHTGNKEQAADLAQDVFIRVFQKLDSFQGNSRFSTWLYTVVRNHCLNEIKSRASQPRIHQPVDDFDPFEFAADPSANPLQQLQREADAAMARRLMQETLEETERTVMYLHYAQELPLDAVTRMLGLSNTSGAKAYIVSARRKLQKAVERLKRQGTRGD
jgi:RNA polymerase sigma-70 factor (ECF subfamily)